MLPRDKYEEICGLVPLACVNAIIFDDSDRVLLVKRTTEPVQGEYWLPGGRILKGEGIEEALRRKVLSETGLDCDVVGLASVSSTTFSSGHHTIDLNFVLHRRDGSVTLDSTSSDHRWVRVPGETSGLRPALQRLLQAKNSVAAIPVWSFEIDDSKPERP